MANIEYKRPDEVKMQRAIALNKHHVTGTILLLAWKMGLQREEIYHLKWSDISFEEGLLYLPDRTIPMDEDISSFLLERKFTRSDALEEVAVSDKYRTHMRPQSISRIVRGALDEVGLSDIRMVELRHDFIIRQLEQHDWPYVSRISGVSVGALYSNYSNYVRKKGRGKLPTEKGPFPIDEQKLGRIIQEGGTSSESLALWLSWKLRLNAREVISLTWDQIDMDKAIIKLSDRSIPVEKDLMARLLELKAGREADADSHVLLTPQSQRPYDFARLSKAVRNVLIRGGMEDITLRDISRIENREEIADAVMAYATENGYITSIEVMSLLSVTGTQAYIRLLRLTESGQLVKVGLRYYPAGTVVPPEQHYEVIRTYLETMGSAYRQDFTNLLHIGERQCGWILLNLVKEGKLHKEGQVYTLPEGREDVTK